jgi:hypothetical protein
VPAPPATGSTTPAPTTAPMGTPMPMGAGMGAGGGAAGGNTNKNDAKKVVPPVIANGKPVAGRLIPNRLEAPVVREISAKKLVRQKLRDPADEKPA